MNVIFMGSPQFACPAVEAILASSHRLLACVTQPDRPKGRGLALHPCAVKALASSRGVPVLTPERIGEAEADLSAFAPDAIVVAAYGQYIPTRIIRLPRVATINIHPSLLPSYRGAAPIQWAVANGDRETGVTILHVAREMDSGDIILQERASIGPDDTAASLEPRLAAQGAALMVRALDALERGDAPRIPQDPARVTWARKLEKEDGVLDFQQPADVLRNRVRGFQPWPGTYFVLSGRRIKVLAVSLDGARGVPGTILAVDALGVSVACGTSALRLLDVQPEGKYPMPASAWARGIRLQAGASLQTT